MRAFAIDQYGSLDELRLRDIEPPECGADELLVKVHAAALNAADWKVLTGKDGGKFLHAARFPLVLGFDFSGVVEAIGPNASAFSLGDEVFGHLPYSRKNTQGSFAELVTIPEDNVAKKPSEASHVEAACATTTGCTALQGLRHKAGLRAGQRVLINGASGGVGSYAVQVAKLEGAEVWGTASAAKADHVEAMGADRVVDYRATALSDLDARFDIVLDAASTSSFGECRRILEPSGTYVTLLPSLGLLTGFFRSLVRRQKVRLVVVKSTRADLGQLADWMSSGKLRHPVDSTFPLEELPEALRYLKSGNARGKIGITLES